MKIANKKGVEGQEGDNERERIKETDKQLLN